jgi:hypothetical protein
MKAWIKAGAKAMALMGTIIMGAYLANLTIKFVGLYGLAALATIGAVVIVTIFCHEDEK